MECLVLRDCIATRSHLDTVLKILGDDKMFVRCRESVSAAIAAIENVQAEIVATGGSGINRADRDRLRGRSDGSNVPLPIQAGGGHRDKDSGGRIRSMSTPPLLSDSATIGAAHELREGYHLKAARIRGVIERGELLVAYQPIYRLDELRIVGLECLSRFPTGLARPPDLWFAEAAEVGLRVELELLAVRAALQELPVLPADIYVTLNVSPETILSGLLPTSLERMPPDRIVLEITEHALIDDYGPLTRALDAMRRRGLSVAVDDAGAGYASLRHVLELKPEIIKLDVSLIRHIDVDLARRALVSALIAFAEKIGSRIVAEGVEAASELAVLTGLGAHTAQGHVLSRPLPLSEISSLLANNGSGCLSDQSPC